MAKRYVEVLALLAKMESSYKTDPTPTGGSNAMLAKRCTIEPLLGTDINRDLLLPYMGHQGIVLAGHYSRVAFDIEMAGAGAAGDVPAYGPLLRMCGLAETITVDTDVQYKPISRDFESGAIYYFLDGVRHIILGARGRLTIPSLKALDLGHFHFELTGLHGTVTDQSMPSVDLDAFVTPDPIGEALTTLSLHGATLPVESLSVDWGQQIEPRFLINYQGIEHVDREATGSIVIEAASMATKNWFTIAKAGTTGALALQHGTTAGHIVKLDAAVTQIGRPTQGESQKIANYTLPLIFKPTDGNDELVLTVK